MEFGFFTFAAITVLMWILLGIRYYQMDRFWGFLANLGSYSTVIWLYWFFAIYQGQPFDGIISALGRGISFILNSFLIIIVWSFLLFFYINRRYMKQKNGAKHYN